MLTITKKAGVAIPILDKIDFKTKAITGAKEGPRNSTSGYLSKNPKTLSWKDIYIYMFIAALFTIAKIQDIEGT